MSASKLVLFSLLGCVTGVLATPTVSQLGPTSILFQNDLSFNASQSALLLYQPQSYTQANTSCGLTNEHLLANVTEDIHAQLRYLEYSKQVQGNASFWVSSLAGSSTARKGRDAATCSAYSYAQATLVQTDCATQLPVLCTQTAPPYVHGQNVTAGTELEVTSGDFSITGFRDARSFRFLGIPFAAPPVGDLRFAPPAPYSGDKNINAQAFGPACMQATVSSLGLPDETVSEDCLTLNVFTPSLPSTQSSNGKKPVALWIYGGSFTGGSGSDEIYDGGNMQVYWAARGDIVVVTMNYRLGVLGFLASATALNGSQGIQDQIAALKWVAAHIESFGGDPNQVTIFGESAGAQSVIALLSSSAAKGLFSAAIAQSAPVNVPYTIRDVYTKSIIPEVATALLCPTTPEDALVKCLRAADASAFVSSTVTNAATTGAENANSAFDGASTIMGAAEPLLPMTGGVEGVVDNQFIYLLGNNTLPNKVPLLIGNVHDEGTLFVENDSVIGSPLPNSDTIYETYEEIIFGNRTTSYVISSGLFPLNTSDADGVRSGLSQLLGLVHWQCPLQDLLSIAHSKGTFPKLYSYRFDKGVAPTSAWPTACQSADNPTDMSCNGMSQLYIFDITEAMGTSNIFGLEYDGLNVLSYNQYVTDTWISFIRDHDPNPSADYLKARGRGYETTLQYVAQTPLQPFDPSSAQAIHHFDAPPSSSGIEYPAQCAVLAQAGFLYDNINNAY
ncbi:hypothetical protein PLICRDRAFT_175791 [Plicaturopsis crispa FD-325 SS-3]|nr:hypothetical protein PLICRDRAFT_175791 [Plicaturopsis crispa FD-325 SS-3]